MVSVGTNAELRKGRNIKGYENAVAPSDVLAATPAITATHVRAKMNNTRIPITASHEDTPAEERKPNTSATNTTIVTDIIFEISEAKTCPHNGVEYAIGMEWKRSKMPCCLSLKRRYAV